MRLSIRCILTILLASVAVAEDSGSDPREVVRLVADRVKAAESLLPVLDYLDWEERFRQLPESERTRLSVANAEQLERYYRLLLEKNGGHRLEKVKSDLTQAVKDKTQLLGTLEKVQAELTTQRDEIKRRLRETTLVISSVSDTAETSSGQTPESVVQVSKEYRGSKVAASLKLRKSGDRWLLISGAPFNPLANPESDEIIGPMPEPEAVLSIW